MSLFGVLFVPWLAAAIPASAADGPTVYREHCAACHGKQGHGDGETAKELKYKPRDFREGKFAFGNTPGAMVKTVMSGIPGEEQARMPAYKSVLTAEEIDAVVAYVRTMMPVEPAPTPTDMKLEPRDGALVVRGILPGLKEGDPPIARGLLIGLPSGFSFEYQTEPVRLLAVRRGEFVSRTDWEERGGRPLTPLGSIVFTTLEYGKTAFMRAGASKNELPLSPLTATLRSTSTKGGVAEIAYDLLDSDGKVRAQVKERPRDVVVSDGSGILQEFELTAPEATNVFISIAFDRTTGPASSRSVRPVMVSPGKWHLIKRNATSTIAVRFLAAREDAMCWVEELSRDRFLESIQIPVSIGPKPTTLKRVIIARGPTTPEQLQKMTDELKELR